MGVGTLSLRLALSAWGRHPRELGLANIIFFVTAAVPMPLLLLLAPGPGRYAGIAAVLVWVWLCFNALAAACALITGPGWRRSDWIQHLLRGSLERLAALVTSVVLLAWVALALTFYLRLGLPIWGTVPVLALLGSLLAWTLLALLASVGVAAVGAGGWRGVWKASVLLPLAYAATMLQAALLALIFSGLLAVFIGLEHWSAPLLFSPLALSPLFTAAYFAVYLVLLIRGLADRAAGGEGPLAPTWRELWNPWR